MEKSVTRPIVDTIRETVADIPGWSPEDQLFALYMLAISTADLDGDIWEIGAWCGRSTSVLALASENSDNGRIYSIDLFPDYSDWYENPDGSYSFKVTLNGRTLGAYSDQTVWKEPFERDIKSMYETHGPKLEEIFRKMIAQKGFSKRVSSYRGLSSDFIAEKRRPVRFAFVDGDHSYDAVSSDIDSIVPHLLSGGWIAFDDAFSSYEGVNRAIEDKILRDKRFTSGQQLTRKCFAARYNG